VITGEQIIIMCDPSDRLTAFSIATILNSLLPITCVSMSQYSTQYVPCYQSNILIASHDMKIPPDISTRSYKTMHLRPQSSTGPLSSDDLIIEGVTSDDVHTSQLVSLIEHVVQDSIRMIRQKLAPNGDYSQTFSESFVPNMMDRLKSKGDVLLIPSYESRSVATEPTGPSPIPGNDYHKEIFGTFHEPSYLFGANQTTESGL
jgi:hypothetical protein